MTGKREHHRVALGGRSDDRRQGLDDASAGRLAVMKRIDAVAACFEQRLPVPRVVDASGEVHVRSGIVVDADTERAVGHVRHTLAHTVAREKGMLSIRASKLISDERACSRRDARYPRHERRHRSRRERNGTEITLMSRDLRRHRDRQRVWRGDHRLPARGTRHERARPRAGTTLDATGVPAKARRPLVVRRERSGEAARMARPSILQAHDGRAGRRRGRRLARLQQRRPRGSPFVVCRRDGPPRSRMAS